DVALPISAIAARRRPMWWRLRQRRPLSKSVVAQPLVAAAPRLVSALPYHLPALDGISACATSALTGRSGSPPECAGSRFESARSVPARVKSPDGCAPLPPVRLRR